MNLDEEKGIVGETKQEETVQKNQVTVLEKEESEKKEVIQKKCLNCGKLLETEEDYCPKCGIKYGETKKIICSKCGNEVEFGKKFCGKCGAKIDIKASERIDFAKNNFIKKKLGKKLIIALIAVALCVIVLVIGKNVYQKFNVSVDELLIQERYQEAYKKAKTDDEKSNIIDTMIQRGKFEEAYNISKDEKIALTNELAYYCNEISESLKDPSSFSLRSVYYDKEEQKIVFSVNGSNSYGGTVVGYWYYTYNTKDEKYSLYTYVSSLEDETSYSWDSSSEKLEKALKNIARTKIKKIMGDNDNKIDSNVVDNINAIFKQNLLKDVKFPKYVIKGTNGSSNV